jgi:ubiquitin-conjugating enzyme E2 S
MQENISPGTIRKVIGEIRKLMETPIDGVKIIPNETDITDIQAIIEGPGNAPSHPVGPLMCNAFLISPPPPCAVDTPYQGGAFRVKLKLGAEFPAAPPKGMLHIPLLEVVWFPGEGEVPPCRTTRPSH